MLTLSPARRRDGRRRVLDLAIAIPGSIVALPVMLATAALVRWRLGTPVLFRQPRTGLDEEAFTVLKFRTMALSDSSSFDPSSDEERMSRLGRRLRSTSLDELPQLWNVIRGDMSLVGPRPLPTEYLALFDTVERRRLEVRPGLTGLAQVSGRNGLSWDDKFRLDVHYVDHRSAWLDIRILVRTVLVVLGRAGVSKAGEATTAPFRGHPDPCRD